MVRNDLPQELFRLLAATLKGTNRSQIVLGHSIVVYASQTLRKQGLGPGIIARVEAHNRRVEKILQAIGQIAYLRLARPRY
jgi:hypothetical protein